LRGVAGLETACPPTAVIPAKAGIQYAGAYRLNHWRLWNTGSSAFADDDSRRMTQLHDLAARFARGLLSNFLNPPNRARAQGMPGARCTRGLVCNRRKKYAHEHTGQRRHPTFPAQWLYGLYRALPGRAGLVVTVAREKRASHELDASIGASGPHDFTVRIRTVRQGTSASTASHPALVTIAKRPSNWDGTKSIYW
jgi:hypothetical protein